jgi:hypothetical protein
VRERRGSYNGFCCRLYPFICWIIIKEGPGNFSGGRSPHWVNHVNLCLSCIVCLLCFCFCICFILLLRGPVFLTDDKSKSFLTRGLQTNIITCTNYVVIPPISSIPIVHPPALVEMPLTKGDNRSLLVDVF